MVIISSEKHDANSVNGGTGRVYKGNKWLMLRSGTCYNTARISKTCVQKHFTISKAVTHWQ